MEEFYNPNRLKRSSPVPGPVSRSSASERRVDTPVKTSVALTFPESRREKDLESFEIDGEQSNARGNERGNNFKVVIRIRPPLSRELDGAKPFQNVVSVSGSGKVLTVSENLSGVIGSPNDSVSPPPGSHSTHVFTFDHVYDQDCTQRKVYENTAKAVVESALEGYNATIFAYGQTGTGKTYTMEGFNAAGSLEERGIIPRAIEQIFMHIQSNISARTRFLVRASYLQIYNESISDLLKPERTNLSIREDKKKGVFVEGLSEWVVRTPAEIYGLMERGGSMRATGSTKMNELSSRSHAVFIIIAEQSRTTYVDTKGNEITMEEFTNMVHASQARDRSMTKFDNFIRQSFKVGKLNLVDLAGSERVRLSGATGQRLEESKKINQSLSALGNVISALTDSRGRQHIPYRDSKLTRILEDSLGGNCKTTMMAMISPALESMVESLSTLKFANRAKNIKNEARVNEDFDQKSLLRKYERELKRLRAELGERNKNVVDKRRLLELDEQRRRAEEDKMAAIRALEERSVEFMREKQEKKRLEQRIAALTSQMLMSHKKRGASRASDSTSTPAAEEDANNEDLAQDPQFREALEEHQEKIRYEYEWKLADLERERETIEEEKAQVDRYKQLLLKQRDIMIALTQRLNERDEQIMALQDELDAYDRHQKGLEEKLDEKTAQLIHLQRVTIEHNASSPTKNSDLDQALGPWGRGQLSRNGAASSDEVGVQPALLLTHKQFEPHVQQVVYSDITKDTSKATASPRLLSGEEKIKELEMLLQKQQADSSRLQKELDDLQNEKSSMESLLHGKLEHATALDQTAVPTVLDDLKRKLMLSGADAANQSTITNALQQQLIEKERENDQLRQQLDQESRRTAPLSPEVVQNLENQRDVLIKERKAIQTIMEYKIKALVGAVAQASSSTIDRAGGIDRIGNSGVTLQREIAALQRLVNASITALRNADSQATKCPSTRNATTPIKSPSNASRSDTATGRRSPYGSSGPSPKAVASPKAAQAGISVERLIQQRRLQMQRDRHNQRA